MGLSLKFKQPWQNLLHNCYKLQENLKKILQLLQYTVPWLTLLNPNINLQILQTDLHTFPLRISWENLITDQGVFSLVINC